MKSLNESLLIEKFEHKVIPGSMECLKKLFQLGIENGCKTVRIYANVFRDEYKDPADVWFDVSVEGFVK